MSISRVTPMAGKDGKLSSWILNALLTLALVVPAARLEAAEIPEDVKANVRARVDSGKFMSVVVGLIDADGRDVFSCGRLSVSGNTEPDERSVYEIGSITKVFTAIILADMVERGELAYDQLIDTALPKGITAPDRDGKRITFAHLSEQTSGLSRLPNNMRPTDRTNPYADYTVAQMYDYLGNTGLLHDPGSKYLYSNVGVGLLGHLLARVADNSYERLVIERIADPLGMADTRVTLTESMESCLAHGHKDEQEVPNWDLPTLAGAGALRSTARDMLTFIEANLSLRKTSLKKAMKATHRPRNSAGGAKMQIGLGWHILSTESRQIVWHNGGTGGYRAFAGFVESDGRGAVVLTNSGGRAPDDIGFHLLDSSLDLAAAEE